MGESVPRRVQSEYVPITLGIIGHRDLSPEYHDHHVIQVRKIIQSYGENYPHSPILVLSSMAEGADQIGVEACIGLPKVETVALLPLEPAEYSRDFHDADALREVERFLEGPSVSVLWSSLLPDTSMVANMEGRCDDQSQSRPGSYQGCARLLSRCSHVLIALWNGAMTTKTGGTSETIAFRLAGHASAIQSVSSDGKSPNEEGETLQVKTSRVSDQSFDSGPPVVSMGDDEPIVDLRTEAEWAPGLDSIAKKIDSFNRLLEKCQNAQGNRLEMGSLTKKILEVSDQESSRLQNKFRAIAASALIAGVCTFVAVSIEQTLFNEPSRLGVVVSLLVTCSLWIILQRLRLKNRYQELRALAEGARVQVAWQNACIKLCPSDHFLTSSPDVAWIRRLLRSAWLIDCVNQQGRTGVNECTHDDANREIIRWMTDQLTYFQGRKGPQTLKGKYGAIASIARRARRLSLLAVLGLSVAGASLFVELSQGFLGTRPQTWISFLTQTSWEAGLSISAAAIAYSELIAVKATLRQYRISEQLFSHGLEKLRTSNQEATPAEDSTAVAEEVGKRALLETSTWFALNGDRDVRPV